jgi:transcriptional antiterminator RfaH
MDQAFNSVANDPAWFCVRTQPKHEHIAARNLRGRLGLSVFNPRLRIERSTRRGVVRVTEPLFPCYVFARCQLAENCDDIRYTSGVSSLVHFGPKIPAVPDEVIEELRQCFESEEPIEVEDQLLPGSQVTLVEGPFMGSEGVIVRVLPARQRVQILLDFLGRTTLTEVDRRSLATEDRSIFHLMPFMATVPRVNLAVAN